MCIENFINKKYIIISIILVSLCITSCKTISDDITLQTETSALKNVIDARDNTFPKKNMNETDFTDENRNLRFDCTSNSFLPLIAKLYEKYDDMTQIEAENEALSLNRHEYAFHNFADGNVDILFAYEPLNHDKESFLEYLKTYLIDDVNVVLLGKDGLVVFDDMQGETHKCEYYYYKNMLNHDQFVLKDVNEILPSEENIINGTYPNIVNFYMIVKNNYRDNEKLDKIVTFLSENDGKEFMKNLSYCVN